MKKLLIATQNKGKLREIKAILSDLSFKLISIDDSGFREDITETGKSFMGNALLKAKTVGEKTKLLTLAEDSGLEVDALSGSPGIFSARFEIGTDADRVNKLLKELANIPKEKRSAKFKSVVAIFNPKDGKIYTTAGESKGLITERSEGSNGFGYDPIFYNFNLGKTNAQATMEEKNKVSHRARALMKAKKILSSLC